MPKCAFTFLAPGEASIFYSNRVKDVERFLKLSVNSFAQLRNCPHLLIESLRTTKFGFAFTRGRPTRVNTLIKLDVERRMLDVRAAAREGPVAQRLEQGTHNPLVPGSNPGGPSFIFGVQFSRVSVQNRTLK